MRAKRCALILMMIPLLLLPGCWSRRELTDVSFAGLMAIDWMDEQYVVTLNINSPRRQTQEQTAGGGKEGVWTVSGQGDTVDIALARIDQILSRSLTLAHIRAVFFGEEMARRGIGPALDFLLRSVEIRPTAWVGITEGKAKELLTARPRQEQVPSDGPMGYHDSAANRSSLTPARRLTEVSNILQEEGIELTLPFFRLGNREIPRENGALSPAPEHQKEIIFGGAGVFEQDRLVAWLSPTGARGQLWARDRVVHGALRGECPDPKKAHGVVFRLRKATGKVRTGVEGGKLRGYITIRVFADVNELLCEGRLPFTPDLPLLEKSLRERVQQDIDTALEAARETGSDIFGFGQSLFRYAPQQFTSRQEKWPELIKQMPISIKVEARVVRMGQISRRYKWRRD